MNPSAKHYILVGIAFVIAIATCVAGQFPGQPAVIAGAVASFATSIASLLASSPMLGGKAAS